MPVTLRPHQIAAADAVEDAFRRGVNRPLIDLCVASGKSYTYGELARRAIARGERVLIGAHRSELVEQNAKAARALGLTCGINSATLEERTWRAPVISCQIQSVFRNAQSFGPIDLFLPDEAHLWPHSETGMFRELHRALGYPRLAGGTGTPFRLQGGSLIKGEAAPFDEIVYSYSIVDGIRDGYLVAPYCATVDDKIDPAKLRVRKGEYTGESSDAQMIEAMDNHIAQMLHYGRNRRSWLVFEASTKSAIAMHKRMNEWGIRTGLVLGSKSKADDINRRRVTEQLRAGQIQAIVNLDCLTTGFDVQEIDMLVCRRRTKSLSLWIQIIGRLLRTIGGTIESSIAAGKADGLLLDFADNTSEFGPLDFIRPKDTVQTLTSCYHCNKRNSNAAARCWNCDEPMTKLCPACLEAVEKGMLDCPHCAHDMRAGPRDAASPTKKLLDTPSGAALISAFRPVSAKEGGWIPVRKAWQQGGITTLLAGEETLELPEALAGFAADARWVRKEDMALLLPNGTSRSSVRMVSAGGGMLVVPMPPARTETS